MSVVLLSNVGLRDVLLRGQPIRPARAEGQRVLREFEALAGDLSIPMLSPLVEYVYDRHRKKVQVTLYGTDNPAAAQPGHRDNDTLHLAEVARRLVERLHRDRAERAWAKAIRERNPSLYNEMLAFFREQLSGSQGWVHEVEVCYVCPVGGTPAANTGLMLAAIERFGEKCRTVYLPEGAAGPVQMRMESLMRRAVARGMALDRLRACAFVEAIPLLGEVDAPGWAPAVARYAASRYHFDFDSADRALQEDAIPGATGTPLAAERCHRFARDLAALRGHELPALIREVYHNARMAWERGEYAGFLGRVFRFQEAALRGMVEDLFRDLSTDVDDDASRRRFREKLRSVPGLEAYLDARGLKGDEPTRPVLKAMVRYALEGGQAAADSASQDRYGRACELLERLDCLSALRNKSVIAHGFEGVSKDRILADYRPAGHTTEPLADMAAALEALGTPVGESPFQEAADLLLKALERS